MNGVRILSLQRRVLFPLLLFHSALWAQDPCLRLEVVAGAIGSRGEVLEGLDSSSFQAEFRGKPVRILSATLDEQPRRILVLLDTSGSMRDGGPIWDVALAAATDVISTAPANSSLGLLTFNVKVDSQFEFSANRLLLLVRLMQVTDERLGLASLPVKTGLRDAILEGLKLFGSFNTGDVIYVITDGGDNASRRSWEEVQRALVAAGVRLFVFGLQTRPNLASILLEQIEGLQKLEQIVTASGGLILLTPDSWNYYSPRQVSEKMAGSIAEMYRQMGAFYKLEIELPESPSRARNWKLELSDRTRFDKKTDRFFYQKELPPCTQESVR